jgi:Phosphoglycerate mutase 1
LKTASKERTLQWICNQHKKGNISFSHKLQRPIGQWSPRMKSLLIHSLLSGFPVNPIYTVEDGGTIYTLDGSQRTSTCIGYVNNEFSLSKDTPNVTLQITENGESIYKEYEIAGKKFKKLDEEVQSTLLACSLEFCTLSDYTDNEVKEMFRRQNAGKPLNGKLLRVVNESNEFSDVVHSLATHPFMNKLVTKTQRKNGSDKDLIIQTFMLICTNHENDFTSFRNKDIDIFVQDHADESIEKAIILKEAMNKFDEAFDEEIKVPITSIPMVLYSGYRITKDKKAFSRLIELINEFLIGYDSNEEYKQFTTSGTSGKENVRGRFDYWRSLIKSA